MQTRNYKSQITIDTKTINKKLKLINQIHAGGIIIIPLIGSIIAFILAFEFGISWVEISILGLMYLLTIIGISVGFHRYFSHNSYATHNSIKIILAILGSIACQGPLIYWVSNHRRHHQYSDRPEDTHSPYVNKDKVLGKLEGIWYAHSGWTFNNEITNTFLFAKDLLKDKTLNKINQLYFLWMFLSFLIPTILGGILIGNTYGLLMGFLWGGCVRLFLTYHFTNSINSITHMYGNRPFNTKENSTNNIWLAIPTGGEAWHNNHHAFPNSAIFGLQWWQIDIGGFIIRILEFIKLVWNVKCPSDAAIASKMKLN